MAGVRDHHVGDGAPRSGEFGLLHGVDRSWGVGHREADHAKEDGTDNAGECWAGSVTAWDISMGE